MGNGQYDRAAWLQGFLAPSWLPRETIELAIKHVDNEDMKGFIQILQKANVENVLAMVAYSEIKSLTGQG